MCQKNIYDLNNEKSMTRYLDLGRNWLIIVTCKSIHDVLPLVPSHVFRLI